MSTPRNAPGSAPTTAQKDEIASREATGHPRPTMPVAAPDPTPKAPIRLPDRRTVRRYRTRLRAAQARRTPTALLLGALLLSSPATASAHEVTVSVGGGLFGASSWFVPVGGLFFVEPELALDDRLSVGLHAEYFSVSSTSSDHASYDREELMAWGLGPFLRYRFGRDAVFDPYLGGRVLLQHGTRGEPADRTRHFGVALGAEVGLDVHLGPALLGVFYAADLPLLAYGDFGGLRYPLYFPGARLGVTF